MTFYSARDFDPFMHLATEQWLLSHTTDTILYLWRSDPCVVIGRHQNPWLEVNLHELQQRGMPLVRRESGGGTVYHDHGNLNYAFIGDTDAFSASVHADLIAGSLHRLGVDVQVSGRSDLFVGSTKVGGAAFRHSKGRSLHHGTVLVDANLPALAAVLKPAYGPDVHVSGAAIPSVRADTANLADLVEGLTMERVIDAIRTELMERVAGDAGVAGDVQVHEAPPEGPAEGRESTAWIRSHAEFLQSDEWRYAKTPRFGVTIGDGQTGMQAALSFDVQKGYVTGVEPGDHICADELEGCFLPELDLTELAACCRNSH